MHFPKPMRRADRGTWVVDYTDTAGKTRRKTLARDSLGETEADALRAYHRLMTSLGRDIPKDDITVELALDLFAAHAEKAVSPGAYVQYRIKLQDFTDHHGSKKVADLKPQHVVAWIKVHRWSDSTKRGAITAVKVALNWCVREGHIETNPVKDVKRPKMGRRERTIAPEERAAIREAAGAVFAEFLDAMTWAGTRPGEIMRLEAAHVDFGAAFARLPGKTTEATGELIAFPLIPPLLELCRRLAEEHPTGPLFRNAEGKPWTPNAVRCRMRRLRAALKDRGIDISGVTAYSYRHSFATDALERGVSLADLAALMNHRDIRTTMNYNHIGQRQEHLRAQAMKAAGQDVKPDAEA